MNSESPNPIKQDIQAPISVIMLGASGATGKSALETLLENSNISKITLLGRKKLEILSSGNIEINQHIIDILNPNSYNSLITQHSAAICTLGVGEPSKMSKEEFIKIDKDAVLDFARVCKKAGVSHFELLASVDTNPKSSLFYLRVKGELVEELKALKFDRLSIFQPSMILTPQNRYGLSQAIVLKVWPVINPLFLGSLSKYKGIEVKTLGQSMALNVLSKGIGEEILHWNDFHRIVKDKK